MGHRTYDNPTAMQVNLRKLDLSLPADPVSIDVAGKLQAP